MGIGKIVININQFKLSDNPNIGKTNRVIKKLTK